MQEHGNDVVAGMLLRKPDKKQPNRIPNRLLPNPVLHCSPVRTIAGVAPGDHRAIEQDLGFGYAWQVPHRKLH